MSIYKDQYIKPAFAIGSHHLKKCAEAASITYPKGTPLVSSSGYVGNATSEAVVDVIGISAEDSHTCTTAGDNDLQYYPVTPESEWIGVLVGTLAQSYCFTDYGLKYDSTAEIWYVDIAEATANQKCVQITELVDPVGTVDGLVKFRFNEYGLATDGLK